LGDFEASPDIRSERGFYPERARATDRAESCRIGETTEKVAFGEQTSALPARNKPRDTLLIALTKPRIGRAVD